MILWDSQMIVTCSDLLDHQFGFDPARGEDELGLHGPMMKWLQKLFWQFIVPKHTSQQRKNAWGADKELI